MAVALAVDEPALRAQSDAAVGATSTVALVLKRFPVAENVLYTV